MNLTDYTTKKLLDLTLKTTAFTSPTALYLALSTTITDKNDTGLTEPGGFGYARQQVTFGNAAAEGRITNTAAVTFPAQTGTAWGRIKSIGLMDASSSGNLIAYTNVCPFTLVLGQPSPSYPIDSITVESPLTGITVALANLWLNHLCRNTSYAGIAGPYVSLHSTPLSPYAAGTLNELSGGNYARTQVTFADAVISQGATSVSNAAVTFPAPNANWGTAVATGINSLSSGAGVLMFYNLICPRVFANGDSASSIPTGGVKVTISGPADGC